MAAVALAGATFVQNLRSRGDGKPAAVKRVGSLAAPASSASSPLTHDGNSVGDAFRVVYRVASPGTVTTEEWTIKPPFDARIVVHEGSSVESGRVVEAREDALGVNATKQTGGKLVVLAPPPQSPVLRPGPVMGDAVAKGLVARREQRVVAKRRCQVYRTSAEGGGSNFGAPPVKESDDHVDLCVDRDGLLLEQLETFQGKVLRQRVALRVEPKVDLSEGELAKLSHKRTVATVEGGGSVRPMDPASQPVGPFVVGDAPSGFVLIGRYEVIPPQADLANPDTRGRVVAGVADVWVRGRDVVILERGARLDKSDPFASTEAHPDVDLGAVAGTGEFLADTTGGEVRALLGDGRYVRIYGTVGLDVLHSVAATLRVTDGGTGPRYLDAEGP